MNEKPASYGNCQNNQGSYCRVYQKFVEDFMSCISNWMRKS